MFSKLKRIWAAMRGRPVDYESESGTFTVNADSSWDYKPKMDKWLTEERLETISKIQPQHRSPTGKKRLVVKKGS